MKKILLSFLLIAALLLSFAACDVGNETTEAETDTPKEDVPQDNITSVVEDINTLGSIDSFIKDSEASNNVATIDVAKIVEAIGMLQLEADFSATVGEETVNGYAGVKDNVVFVDLEDEGKYYIFVENDLKLVGVSDKNGEIYGSVEDSIKGVFDAITSMSGSEDSEEVENPSAEFTDKLLALELPEIKAEDIEYRDGKYFVSNEYVKNAVDKVFDVVLADGMQMTPADITNVKSAVRGYIDKMGLEIYLYMQYEEVTGFGLVVDLDKEFATDMLEMSEVKATLDVHDGKLDLTAKIANEEVVYLECKISAAVKTNDKGEISGLTVDADVDITTVSYDVDYDTYEIIDVFNTFGIDLDLNLDVDKLNSEGTLLDFKLEVAQKVNNNENKTSLTAKIDSYDSCNKFKVEVGYDAPGDDDNVSVRVDLNKKAEKMPSIPQEVLDERQNALDEYEEEDFNIDDWY